MDLGLLGKSALVIGASGGIGGAIARLLGEEGCDVAVHYASGREAAEETASRIRAVGRRALLLQADLTHSTEAEEVVRRAVAELGRLDILVNSAGVNLKRYSWDITDAQWDRVIGINLNAVFYVCRAASRVMKDQRAGVIVNLSSTSGAVPTVGSAAYGSTKAAILALTKTLAGELGPYGVRAVVCTPGLTATQMSANLIAQWGDKYLRAIPLARAASPEEIAGVVVFLASDRASYLNGVTVDVHGGKFAVQDPGLAWEKGDLPNPDRQ